jgi:long-chain acyl-CoA synthetase
VPNPDVAMIVYTSGTTGNPKGCSITHANLWSQVRALRRNIPLNPDCRLASILPLSHLFELTCGLLYPISQGAAIHYVPSRRGSDILRVFQDQRISHMIAVPQLLTLMGQALDEQLRASVPPPVYRLLFELADRLPLRARRSLFWLIHQRLGGHLTMIASGGAALPIETHRLWERIGVRIVEGYGATECSPVVCCGTPDGSTPLGSVGKPIQGVEVQITPEGELLVHGPNVMKGYWNDPVRTAEVLHDGWYATGDLARIDDRENIWILGRLKELIVLPSGLNVWPEDVEDVLRSHPSVKDAAVVAVPTESGGASLHAFVIPKTSSDRDADLSAVVAWANGRLAQHQRIATASWWESETGDFPRTSLLKVRRHLLPPPPREQRVRIESTLSPDDPVGQAIAAVTKIPNPGNNQTLAELGVDSLTLIELALTLEEKTGKPIADEDLRTEMTVADVRAKVASITSEKEPEELERGELTDGARVPLWPYTWGRIFRSLGAPLDLLYRAGVTRTIVLGGEHLSHLPPRVIFAGTHRSYPDLMLLRHGLARTTARSYADRLLIATSASRYTQAGAFGLVGTLLFGLYPIQQQRGQSASLRGLARLAAEGSALVIFPQGHHVTPAEEHAGAEIAHFRTGVAHLAAALDAAVVPFGIAGSERIVPPKAPPEFKGPVIAGGIPVMIARGPLAIAFGAPLPREPGEDAAAFTARLERACFELSRQAEVALDKAARPV